MPIFTVTYIVGEQGYSEKETVTEGVEADTALAAIYKIAPSHCRHWTERPHNWNRAALLNPDAPNRSEEYCDYYFSELAAM